MKAIVLGAKEGSGNIGDAIVDRLVAARWQVYADDCYNEWGERYEVPLLDGHSDAEALVVTLGATAKTPFHQQDDAELEDVIRGCLTLPLLAAREYVRARSERTTAEQTGWSRIVFIGSYAHEHPFSAGTAYCAAKAGLDMATRTLGWELTGLSYGVHIVHPYHVEGTPMWERVQEGVQKQKGWTRQQADDYARQNLLMDRPLSADDVASAVQSILEARVWRWMSGGSVRMYGGTR